MVVYHIVNHVFGSLYMGPIERMLGMEGGWVIDGPACCWLQLIVHMLISLVLDGEILNVCYIILLTMYSRTSIYLNTCVPLQC